MSSTTIRSTVNFHWLAKYTVQKNVGIFFNLLLLVMGSWACNGLCDLRICVIVCDLCEICVANLSRKHFHEKVWQCLFTGSINTDDDLTAVRECGQNLNLPKNSIVYLIQFG